MNLLMVAPNLPCPTWGAGNRNYQLLKALAQKYTVSLLALVDQSELKACNGTTELETFTYKLQLVHRPTASPKRVQQFLNTLSGKSHTLEANTLPEMQEALDRLFAHDHYDIVLFESVLIANYRVPEGVTVVIDQHNIEYELLERTYQKEKALLRKWYNWNEFRLLKPIELERCSKASAVVVTSEREQLALKKLLPKSAIDVVPNGVDTQLFRNYTQIQEQPKRLIFTGTMCYYPNIDAVLYFAQECWPLIRVHIPDITWQIVGISPPAEVQQLAELPGISVTGSVPDIKPYIAEATLAIVPLRIGSGTRLKILEALAMEKAVVTTSQGSEGLAVESDKHLMIADQPTDFAQAVIELVQNVEKRRTLGTAGRALVETEYSWQHSGARMLAALERLHV